MRVACFFNLWLKFHQVSIESSQSKSWVSDGASFGYGLGMTHPHRDGRGGVAGGTRLAPCATPVAPFARVCASSRTCRGCYNPVKTITSPMSSRRVSKVGCCHNKGSYEAEGWSITPFISSTFGAAIH